MFVIDDDPLARGAVVEALNHEQSTTVVGDAAVSAGLGSDTAARGAHVVVLGMQRVGAETLVRQIEQVAAIVPAKVVVFAAAESASSTAAAVLAGARGVIDKAAGVQQLRSVVAAVAAGNLVMAPQSVQNLTEFLPRAAGSAESTCSANLTKTETAVLRLLAEGLSTQETATKMGVRPGTVKSHVSHILAKLGVPSRTQAVAMTYRLGLLLD